MKRFNVEVPNQEYWQKQIKCQQACPVKTDARGYVRAIAEGRFEEAYLIARGPNPLASICGRVCGAPCETACRRGEIDQSLSIRALKRFASDQFGLELHSPKKSQKGLLERLLDFAKNRDCQHEEELASIANFLKNGSQDKTGKKEKIAIIGSGPAGLAAAHDLALLGFAPTIYEMEKIPAGMLAVGIPEYRLPRDLIAAEVEFIRNLGVEFVCDTQVGKDIAFEEIRSHHKATLISVGLKRSRSIPIPGADGSDVLGGVEFLRDIATGHATSLGKEIVVIGGGNVAYDIARTLIRQTGVDISRTALRTAGVRKVHLCSLESLEELPADDVEILEGDEEGVHRHHSLGPKEILRDGNGRVTGVTFQKCTRVFDETGRFAPQFDESDLTTIHANTVIWSIGQQGEISFLKDSRDIETNERGQLVWDSETNQTSAKDVFVAGDISYGPKLLIDAVASGKKVARAIYRHLKGHSLESTQQLVHLELPNWHREEDYEKLSRTRVPTLPPEDRTSSQQTEVETGFTPDLAIREGCRCLDCGVNTIFDSEKCILCGGCADVCPELCLELVSLDYLEGDDELSQVLDERTGSDQSGFSAIIKDETKCIRCALCAERCPVDAITMERIQFETCWNPTATS